MQDTLLCPVPRDRCPPSPWQDKAGLSLPEKARPWGLAGASCGEFSPTPHSREGPGAEKQDEEVLEGKVPGKPFYLTPFITALPFIVSMGKNNISPSPLTGRTCQSAGQAAAWRAGQEAWHRDSLGTSSSARRAQPWLQRVGLELSCEKFSMPSGSGWVGKGHNARCGKGWRWDGTGLQRTSEGDRNNRRDERRKEMTWFGEHHAAPTRNWSKVRLWWVMD